MDTKRRRGVVALLFILSIGSYFRIEGSENVRPILILSIFISGIFAGILLADLMHLLRSRKADKDKMI